MPVVPPYFKSGYVALLTIGCIAAAAAQQPTADPNAQAFTVFLRQKPVGQESVSTTINADGITIRGSNRLGPPLDVVIRSAEIHYTGSWQPTRLLLEGTTRGEETAVKTAFADGQATSEITVGGKTETKVDQVSADTLVLPNAFLGSYAALARRLVGAKTGAGFRAFIAPQGEVAMKVDGVFSERIETPRVAIAATRYALLVSSPPPSGEMQISIWVDDKGGLLRLSVPAQTLEVAREDIASAAARTTAFAIPGDETVHIPASGFNLAASVSKPPNAKGKLPAVVVVGGINVSDRDGVINGVPVMGELAASLVDAGFLVVRYDRRGVGQSGGRAETATVNDYAEDVRQIVTWLEKRRQDVDKEKIALVGHREGAWIAMRAADRDDRIGALALIDAGATTGAELVLEQQRQLLARSNVPESEQNARIELQQKINAAALKGAGWDGIPETLRNAADTPWFQSYLAFDPGRIMRDIDQPILIVRGSNDTAAVAPSHADRLAELARARRRKVAADVIDDAKAIGAWLSKNLE